MKTKTIIKRLLVLCCIVAALALAAFAGYLIYDHVGYKPFGSIDDDEIETLLFSYDSNSPPESWFEIIDYEIPELYYDVILDNLRNIRVFFPHEDQNLVYYGNAYILYTIVLKDGTKHTAEIVGWSKNDIDTGYYLDVASDTFRIMKDGVRTYYVRVDGVLYDIRDELVYTDLRDYSRGIINSYDREYN